MARRQTQEPAPPLPGAFRETFDSFYTRERESIVGLALVLSRSRAAAEDLAQEAFVQALIRWDQLQAYDDPGAWVRRVVANHAVSRFRRMTVEARAILRIGHSRGYTPDIADQVTSVWDEVVRLPKRQAQVIALRFVDGRSIEEISRILECSENTTKTHLMRAKKTLASRLDMERTNEDH